MLLVKCVSVVVNVMLCLMSVMSPPSALCKLSVSRVVKLCTFCFRGELGFRNCDDVCMCVVKKQYELLVFVFNSVYVDLKYNEIYFTFTARSVCLSDVCSHVVIFGLSVRLSCGCGGSSDCDTYTVVCVPCMYTERE